MAGISGVDCIHGSQPDEGRAYEAGLKTAQDTVEKLNNSVQQLKAEIAALANELYTINVGYVSERFESFRRRLRQLSAV